MPRVPVITGKSDVPAEHHGVLEEVLKTFGGVRGPFSVLLHCPELARHFLGIVHYMRESSVVEHRHRSLAALVAAREREGGYVWAAQLKAARKAGVTEEAIAVIRGRGDPAGLPEIEREIVAYARQLVRESRVDRPKFDALHRRYGTRWLVELTVVAGYFGSLSGLVNAFEVSVPEDGDRLS